jgi:hypothetical protein
MRDLGMESGAGEFVRLRVNRAIGGASDRSLMCLWDSDAQ